MNKKLLTLFVFVFFVCSACAKTSTQTEKNIEVAPSSAGKTESSSGGTNAGSTETESAKNESNNFETANTNSPKTLREFFALLPAKYFTLEGCDTSKDKNCDKARAEYIKTFLEVEDAKNGYWKSGCDGAQSCLTMALFKRSEANYVVHILTEHEGGENSYFLDYKNGKWSDIGAEIVPEYSDKNTYVPPQKGTIVEVFKKNFPKPEFSERGAKIYDLTWNNGKFSIKK